MVPSYSLYRLYVCLCLHACMHASVPCFGVTITDTFTDVDDDAVVVFALQALRCMWHRCPGKTLKIIRTGHFI